MQELMTDFPWRKVIIYVDDILVFSKKPGAIMAKLQEIYELKGVGIPEYYSGADLYVDTKGYQCIGAKTFIKTTCDKIEKKLEVVLKNYVAPLVAGDHPEVDESELLTPQDITKYQMLCGCAQWAVSLGRWDIQYATNTMARFATAPRLGHYQRMLRLFGYLKYHPKGRICIDVEVPDWKAFHFAEYDWTEKYPDAYEYLPDDAVPIKLTSDQVHLSAYVDSDQAHDLESRRSHTGYILCINRTPVKTYSKKQGTIETSTYGAELVAARVATEAIIDYRYCLRMLGVDVNQPSTLFIDNQSVVWNATLPSSTLKKKHHSVAYHKVRECVAGGIIRVTHIPSQDNIADILTKPLSPARYWDLLSDVLYGRTPKDNSHKGELRSEDIPRTIYIDSELDIIDVD